MRVTITLPSEVLQKARSMSRALGLTLDEYIVSCLELRLRDDEAFDRMLREMLAETGGPMTAQERRWADAALGYRVRPRSVARTRRRERA